MSDKTTALKYIIDSAGLEEIVGILGKAPMVGVDTESNSLYAYREQVCLIQFSVPGTDYLVDPLSIEDISPLGAVFADPAVEKIFHAAEYDVLTMKRDFGFEFANLFDTMVSARILGREKVGLGSMIEEQFGVQLKKKFQRADWGKRPLPKDMLDYARLDTHYLIRMREKLHAELAEKDRLALAEEDFERLCHLDGNGPEPSLPSIWRMNGVKALSPEQATILKHLVVYRQEKAKQVDRPLFKVIGDKTLVAIAEMVPSSLRDLEKVQGMSPKQVRRHGKALLKTVRQGGEDEPSFPPKRPRMPDDQYDRLEALRQWRKVRARQSAVESDVVLPRDLMEALARENPQNPAALAEVLASVPWRLEQYGQEIGELLARHG